MYHEFDILLKSIIYLPKDLRYKSAISNVKRHHKRRILK